MTFLELRKLFRHPPPTLSVRQPWANQICEGLKWCENRNWQPPQSLLRIPVKERRILIHASGTGRDSQQIVGYVHLVDFVDVQKILFSGDLPPNFPVDEKDKVSPSERYASEIIREAFPKLYRRKFNLGFEHCDFGSNYWWLLGNPVKFKQPIRNVQGKLRIWYFSEPWTKKRNVACRK